MKARLHLSVLLFVVLLAAGLPLPSVGAVGIDDPHLRLGKVDPGHQSVHHRTVTNTQEVAVDIDVRVTCPCPVYVQVTPTTFRLDPGAKQSLEITVDVPQDADPGAHDTQIQVTERGTGGTGGTAVASATISAFFQVRSAALYLSAATGDGTLTARFVNAYEEDLTFEIEGTLQGHGLLRSIDSRALHAGGSAPGSRVTTVTLDLPLDDRDPLGIYTVALSASWSNETTGRTGSFGPVETQIAHGALVQLRAFHAKAIPGGLHFTGTLGSIGTEPVEASLTIEITGEDGATTTTTSTPVALAPAETQEVTHTWSPTRDGIYTVVAHAVYETAAGVEGRSGDWPAQTLTVSGVRSADGGDDGGGDDADDAGDGEEAGPAVASGQALLAIVALLGVGLGAAVALLVNRRGGGKR